MFWSSPHCIPPDKILFCSPVVLVTDCFIDFITSISTEKRPKWPYKYLWSAQLREINIANIGFKLEILNRFSKNNIAQQIFDDSVNDYIIMDIICCNAKIKRPCSHLRCAPNIHICFIWKFWIWNFWAMCLLSSNQCIMAFQKYQQNFLWSEPVGFRAILKNMLWVFCYRPIEVVYINSMYRTLKMCLQLLLMLEKGSSFDIVQNTMQGYGLQVKSKFNAGR